MMIRRCPKNLIRMADIPDLSSDRANLGSTAVAEWERDVSIRFGCRVSLEHR